MDNLTKFKDLEINDLFEFDGVIWMKTYERARPDGGALNAFDMRLTSPNFAHIDEDEAVLTYRPKMRRKVMA